MPRHPPGRLHRWPHLVPPREAPRLLTAWIDLGIRIAALAALGGALVVAATHWAVRTRRLRLSSPWARWVRRWSDPLLKPFERRVVSWGGNPQDAPLWLTGAVLLTGLALILVVRWVLETVVALDTMRGAGSEAWLRLATSGLFSLLMTAVLIRVVGSWLGLGRHNRWMRPFYLGTDWIVEPIRRRLPPFGVIDLSPVAAYLILLLLREAVLGALG